MTYHMKKITSLLLGVALSVITFTGCTSIDKNVEVLRPAQTNYVDQVKEEFVPVVETKVVEVKPAEVLADGTIIPAVTQEVTSTNLLKTLITNRLELVTPAITYTNLALSSGLKTTVGAVGDLAPFPWAGAATTGVLALGNLVLAFMNNRKKKQVIKLADEKSSALSGLETATLVGQTLVQNFEELRKAALEIPVYRNIDNQVMTSVQKIQEAVGVKKEINSLVDDHTETTIPR